MLATNKLKRFFQGEEAATAVEYAVLLALIVLAVSQSVLLLGSSTESTFNAVADVLP